MSMDKPDELEEPEQDEESPRMKLFVFYLMVFHNRFCRWFGALFTSPTTGDYGVVRHVPAIIYEYYLYNVKQYIYH